MATILFKRATLARWQEVNPILPAGEPGFITDKNILKIGDGVTKFMDLQPANLSSMTAFSRRDLESNYKSDYVPANGEICFVDTPSNGLRVKIGNGQTTFGDLPYDEIITRNIDSVIIKGYYKDNAFYFDEECTTKIEDIIGRIYVDFKTSRIYTFDGTYYQTSSGIANATAEVAGIVKLYDTVGYNTDGTMTQRAITDELDDKVEVKLCEEDSECLIFSNFGNF